MPVSKKPLKSRTHVQILRPLTIRDELKCELPVQLAIAAIGSGAFGQKQLAELIVHGEIVRDAGDALKYAEARGLGVKLVDLALAVIQRFERTKAWGVTGPEMLQFREITAATVPWVRTVPNTIIYRVVTQNRKKRGLK